MTTEQDKRSSIQSAAGKLFSRKGFHATTIREIGREAGVNSSMISYYFKSKKQLLISILEKSIDHLSNIVAQLSGQNLTEIEKLNRLLDFYTAKILTDGASTYIMLQEQLLRSVDCVKQMSEEINEKQFRLFEGIVNSGIANGAFRPHINTRMIFYTLLGTFRHIIIANSSLWLQDNPVNQPKKFQSDISEANAYLKYLLKHLLLAEKDHT